MQDQDERHESWGVKINTSWQRSTRDCPTWARPVQREKWGEQGVVIWNHETRQITKLKATQALWVLDQLCTRTDWRQHGMIVGEPAVRLSVDNPDEKPQNVLVNQIHLDAARTQELLNLLQNNEEMLQRMSEAEEKERRRRLAAAYDLILGYARRDKRERNRS